MNSKHDNADVTKKDAEENLNDDPLRKDLDAALRFLHVMGMQTKHDVVDLTGRLYALLEELVGSGKPPPVVVACTRSVQVCAGPTIAATISASGRISSFVFRLQKRLAATRTMNKRR